MKLRHLLSLLFLAGLLPAQSPKSDPESEKAVLALEKDFLAAVTRGDATAMDRMIADDFYFVGPEGEVQDKVAFVGAVRSGDLKIVSSVVSEMTVHFTSPTMVILTYRSADRGTFLGSDISGNYRWTDVAIKRNGRWQFFVAHGVKIPAGLPRPAG